MDINRGRTIYPCGRPFWYGALESRDAAEVMGVSVRTVQVRWQKALIEIRQALGNLLPAT